MGNSIYEEDENGMEQRLLNPGEEEEFSGTFKERPQFYPCAKCGQQFTARALPVHFPSCNAPQTLNVSNSKQSDVSKSNIEENRNIVNSAQIESVPTEKIQDCILGLLSLINPHHLENTTVCANNTSGPMGNATVEKSGCSNSELNVNENGASNLKNDKASLNDESNEISNNDIAIQNGVPRQVLGILVNQDEPSKYKDLSISSDEDSNKIMLECSEKMASRASVIVSPESPFKCQYCGEDFNSKIERKKHMQTHNSTTPCCVCGVFVPWDIYGGHIIKHSEVNSNKTLTCPKCPHSFNGEALLLAHFRMHISSLQFFCTECFKCFSLAIELKHHALEVHNRLELQPFHCYICFRRFSHSQAIINHMRLHTGETPFHCGECGRSFTQIGNLHRHLGVHRGDRPHKCDKCERAFADPATLRNHIRIHTGEAPYKCNVCTRAFTQIGNLKRHMTKHLSERPHLCSQCGKGFAHESTLRNHKRIHTGEQPFKCTVCERAFSQVGNLKRHMAKHAPEQSFMCGDCAENFETSQELVQHKCKAKMVDEKESNDPSEFSAMENLENLLGDEDSTVNGKNPNMFQLSEKDSGEDELMDEDAELKETKNGPHSFHTYACEAATQRNKKWRIYPCPVCGKVYTWKHDLKIHYRIHSGEKPYKCDICKRGFAQSGAVRIHKERHHRDSLLSESNQTSETSSESVVLEPVVEIEIA